MTPNPKDIPDCFTTVIEHAFFNDCLDRLRELVRMKTSTRIVIVTGPTGAGKTTARDRFAAELESLAAPEIAANPEIVPYGVCAVKAPGPTAFSWKDTYLQMLMSLQHPFADSRLLVQPKTAGTAEGSSLKPMTPEATHRLSNDRLFRILQKTIIHRHPKALIFDEAHHLLSVASSQSLVYQLEHLKYIADETQTLHVLFGTYELNKLMDLSSAIIRRREIIHFPRYAYDPNDQQTSLEPFAKVVAIFAKDLDAQCEKSLLEDVPNLYQGSVGCIGVLRDWLFRAFNKAKESGKNRITEAILSQTMLTASDRLELIKAAQAGESYFSKRSLCENEYLQCIGFLPPDSISTSKSSDEQETKKRKPGQRKPHNDPVGTDHLNPSNDLAA